MSLQHLFSRMSFIMLLCFGITGHSQAITLTIAAGAGYKRPVTELTQAFERDSGIQVNTLYGNMGQVLAQATQTDKITVVFGDRSFLENAKQVRFNHFIPAGQGRLVIAWAKGKTLHTVEDLTNPEFSRIALPDMRHAVYGKAASEFITQSGLAAKLPSTLLTVATVPQVSAYLIRGETDAGFINLTEALGIQDKIGGYLEIEAASYSPIQIVGGIIQGRENTPGVHELESFLNTEAAHSILNKHGL